MPKKSTPAEADITTSYDDSHRIVPLEPSFRMLEMGIAAAEANPQITLADKPALYYAYKAMVLAATE